MSAHPGDAGARSLVARGRAVLGIELGSTTIKASLVSPDGTPLASGRHVWENQYVDGVWTYSLDAVRTGLQDCYANLVADCEQRFGVRPTTYASLGVSAMMHGYLALGEDGGLLVPFRTWRNTSTGRAAAELSERLGANIPLRWSVAHLYQAVLDDEPHVPQIASVTTLAGLVHRWLTGRHVLGVGDASGMFPVDSATLDYDDGRLAILDAMVAGSPLRGPVRRLLPEVLPAGADAGSLTPDGARLLDPGGALEPGVPLCPPEGDAGTGMVATSSIAPGTANVSVGTSVFAMVVLDRPLGAPHDEVDMVTTPAGDPVAMVHCNNGASELQAWAEVFGDFARALGSDASSDDVFRTLLDQAVAAEPDAGGVLAYNYLSGEPVTGLLEGRPMVVRSPGSRLTLANLVRAQAYAVFASLSVGMRVLHDEDVRVDVMFAHGGLFRTEGVAQRLLAAALGTPVAVGSTPGDGGAWGMAVLAAYRAHGGGRGLAEFLREDVFAALSLDVAEPDPVDVAGFADYLRRFEAGLPVQHAAVGAIP